MKKNKKREREREKEKDDKKKDIILSKIERYNLNKEYIYKEIMLKNSSNPYIVEDTIYNIENDMDVFPYPRYFQSVPTDDYAFIAEREAGWTPKNLDNMKKVKKEPTVNPNFCFQAPCSVVYPCYQQSNEYIGINRGCTNQYR